MPPVTWPAWLVCFIMRWIKSGQVGQSRSGMSISHAAFMAADQLECAVELMDERFHENDGPNSATERTIRILPAYRSTGLGMNHPWLSMRKRPDSLMEHLGMHNARIEPAERVSQFRTRSGGSQEDALSTLRFPVFFMKSLAIHHLFP